MRRAFHYESSTLKQAEEERTERLRSTHSCFGPMPGALQQRERERASGRVYGANISLAGSPGRSGEQGSAGEGEAACPAVN